MSDGPNFPNYLNSEPAPQTERRAAVFYLDGALLAKLLHLPEGVIIRKVSEHPHQLDTFCVTVEGGNVPPVHYRGELPVVTPRYQHTKQPDGTWKTELQSW